MTPRQLLTLLPVLLLGGVTCFSQRTLRVLEESGENHLVTGYRRNTYQYMSDGEQHSARVGSVQTVLLPSTNWFPGFVKVEGFRATSWTMAKGATDSHRLEYQIKLTPNRDINDAYIIYHAERENGMSVKIAARVGDLRKGRTEKLNHTVRIPRDFSLRAVRPYVMARGYEILVSEVDAAVPTPYQRWLESTGEEHADGPPQPMTVIHPAPVPAEDGSPLHGNVNVRVEIDDAGFVIAAEAVKPGDGPLVQAVLDVIYLWEFKPLIKNGKPDKCTIVLPFQF